MRGEIRASLAPRCLSWSAPGVLLLLANLAPLSLALGTAALAHPGRNFDARTGILGRTPTSFGPDADQAAAVAVLRGELPELAATIDRSTGVTRSIFNRVGYLSSRPAGTHDPLTVALDWVRESPALLGLDEADLTAFAVTDVVFSAVSGATHIYLGQRHAGLPVYNGQLHVNVNREGRIISCNNRFFPHLPDAAGSTLPAVSAPEAVAAAAAHLGAAVASPPEALCEPRGAARATRVDRRGISLEAIEAQLMWLPIRRGTIRLVWGFQIHTMDRRHVYDLTVDAETGQIWTRFDWVDADAYLVYPRPVESPSHSDWGAPESGRSLIVDPANGSASPLGWHGIPGAEETITRGNNVHAYQDWDANDEAPAHEVDCGTSLSCVFPLSLDSDPALWVDAAVTNLFYWANVVHDIQYQYGFDETAGNFQLDNLGRGGLGGDELHAEAQDGAAFNNASFLTPPEGSNPRMQMFTWNLGAPHRDGDLDAGIVVHEYGHGISRRLVGGPSNVSCLNNTQQPGEGLSDWWALVYTHREGDAGTDSRGLGTYPLFEPPTGPGIRTQPYSTDSTINNHTFESIRWGGLSVPHGIGEVWAQAAWEVYWALIDRHGFDPNLYDAMGGSGNQRMMLYVNEGLKNTACSPTFADVRDGIVQAAIDNHGGEDVCRIWRAFAAFGLGVDAAPGSPWNLNVGNGYSTPSECRCGVLDAPAGLVVRALGGGRTGLRWEVSRDAGGYNVYRSRGSCAHHEGYQRVARGQAGRRFVDPNGAGVPHCYRVTAVDENGDCESPPSPCGENPSFDLRPSDEAVGVCAPGAAELVVEVASIAGFEEPVFLAAVSPPGTWASFAPNPVRPPGRTRLTVAATTSASAGDHAIDLSAAAGSPRITRGLSLELSLFDSAPAAPRPISPPDLASDIALTPTLRWSVVEHGAAYTLEVATDPAFSHLAYQESVAGCSTTISPMLSRDTTYWWRTRAENPCGASSDSPTSSFHTSPLAILLVDDDDDQPNVRHSYANALDGLRLSYDVWDTRQSSAEPTAADLEPYNVVIWFSGEEYGGTTNPQAGPTSASEAALAAFLGRHDTCLAIISQDYLWDMGGRQHDEPTPFMRTHLGLASGESDVSHTSVSGHGPFAAVGPLGLVYPFRNYSDSLSPGAGATLAFSGETEDGILDAAVIQQGRTWRTTYWGFPLESVAAAADRQRLMELLVDYCRWTGAIFRDGFESGDLGAWAERSR